MTYILTRGRGERGVPDVSTAAVTPSHVSRSFNAEDTCVLWAMDVKGQVNGATISLLKKDGTMLELWAIILASLNS